jgi:hypothetical protein
MKFINFFKNNNLKKKNLDTLGFYVFLYIYFLNFIFILFKGIFVIGGTLSVFDSFRRVCGLYAK